ncbi:hypothetical protein BC826DRAFT_516638 [Russula brevipes]|nr:hypothetical protein BC826DRAFT_516638 [Russula brevipes]
MVSHRFRWVYCQLDNLRRCMPSSIRKALDELPITLDETYERILQGIPKQKRQHAHQLFQCIVAAIRPLRVEELAEIFAIEFGANTAPKLLETWRPEHPEEAVLSTCSTLIAVIEDEGSKIVQFSHFSVKEFLTSGRLQASEVGSIRDYYIPLEPAHMTLARACLTVLLQFDENVDKRRLAMFPLAFYAAEHWVDHAKFGDVSSQIMDVMEDSSTQGSHTLLLGLGCMTLTGKTSDPLAVSMNVLHRCGNAVVLSGVWGSMSWQNAVSLGIQKI